ncbi:hypothetical protein DM01DRAFT_1404033 [Hesseltinella vesiculosa]|uniref:HMG box domain-containing protein n=1 Tax=Hesseltinella vesiculosa TaxID=101127 RepID=A0A1X2GXP6_9FUNG|nr:hypothetical protein DM01DRAFT_1404033 [Hesseltinella vesiculosa]
MQSMASTMVSPLTVTDPAPSSTMTAYTFSGTTPTPPNSASPMDLPPLPGVQHRLSDARLVHPPSPSSPNKSSCLPAYLEPQPLSEPSSSAMLKHIRPQFYHALAPPLIPFTARRATAPTLGDHSPLPSIEGPRRSASQSLDPVLLPQKRPSTSSPMFDRYPNTPSTSASTSPVQSPLRQTLPSTHPSTSVVSSSLSPFEGQDPSTSPTLAAACASAANLHTSTHPPANHPYYYHHHRSDDEKKIVDQSMFLTKNAHIKRPRNAWIHFRCHYGQALKTQDPSLRAEEISKRASRRWSLLSENEKRPWHQLAEQEKLAHKEAFPEYRYCPKRSNSTSSASTGSAPYNAPSYSPMLQARMHKKLKKD